LGGVRLVKICVGAAGLVPASKSVSIIHLSAGGFFSGKPAPDPKNKANLMRCGIFRGKISRAKLKTKNRPRTRTHLRQQHYE